MGFFRIKKINGKDYAYAVKNEWKMTKGSRQKVKNYLGRVFRFELKKDTPFLQFIKLQNIESYIDENDKNKIFSELVEWELFKFGISKQNFSIDLKNIAIRKNNKGIVFFINDGFMCDLTLKNLFEFKFKSEGDEDRDAYLLAKSFVDAGIKVPNEVFVKIFEKLYKEMVR